MQGKAGNIAEGPWATGGKTGSGIRGAGMTQRNISIRDLEYALADGGSLDDRQLLTLIAGRRLGKNRALRAVSCLLQKHGSLPAILSQSFSDLARTDGVPQGLAIELVQIARLVRAALKADVRDRVSIKDRANLIEYCKRLLVHAVNEEFHVLLLNRRGEILDQQQLQTGTVDHVTVYPREVMAAALRHRASFIILVHNHPAGSAQPSRADVTLTEEIMRVGQVMGIHVADHVIVADGKAFSFHEEGLIGATRPPTRYPGGHISGRKSILARIG